MKKLILVLTLVLVLGIGLSPSYSEQKCIYYATIENDQYGAVNPDSFDEMQSALKDMKQDEIKELLSKNRIKRIITDRNICVIQEAFYKQRSRISIPGYNKEYWVDSHKLSKIE